MPLSFGHILSPSLSDSVWEQGYMYDGWRLVEVSTTRGLWLSRTKQCHGDCDMAKKGNAEILLVTVLSLLLFP